MTDPACQVTTAAPQVPSFHQIPITSEAHSVLDTIKNEDQTFSLVNTVDENKTFFTPAEIIRGKRARNLLIMMGRPSSRDFKAILNHNLVPNIKVSREDHKIAEMI